jgi:hypothetical protein
MSHYLPNVLLGLSLVCFGTLLAILRQRRARGRVHPVWAVVLVTAYACAGLAVALSGLGIAPPLLPPSIVAVCYIYLISLCLLGVVLAFAQYSPLFIMSARHRQPDESR